MTLISYVSKKRKAIILPSLMCHSSETDYSSGKSEIVAMYNLTRGGVDEFNKKCAIYSTRRRTQRWSMTTFFRILNICTVNAYILFQSYPKAQKMKHRNVMLSLVNQAHIKRRLYLLYDLKLEITRMLWKNEKGGKSYSNQDIKIEKKCRRCPLSKKNQKCINTSIVKIQSAFNVRKCYALTATRHFVLDSERYCF